MILNLYFTLLLLPVEDVFWMFKSWNTNKLNQLNEHLVLKPQKKKKKFPSFCCIITGDSRDTVMLLLQPFYFLFMAKKKKNGVKLTKDLQRQFKIEAHKQRKNSFVLVELLFFTLVAPKVLIKKKKRTRGETYARLYFSPPC